ncbi:DeoR/GlpR family DNA-binding transcription regulator [Acuticoccus sp. MNP-M23]|uniref:DeoR/GlpR family DNA-binding transcription regulator n=1 Tax=Acuticoccus sp. MNP-M23 TaxID=3072793 RepID=UPI0028164923|nr:DeoR/GlpR family DNA-binding transcription regulator [Acuticoccus sp. MNP-M23]WMS44710.1 DeoR/GlpR family DNA-binding transcription regulator [Acuticoccus sp. MNP-M23]
MAPEQRRHSIATLVHDEGRQSVEALAVRFDVSAETIRRDLSRLAADGLVRKIHGGALKAQLHAEPSLRQRMGEDESAKATIAALLTGVIRPGDTLFIDSGSTTTAAARALLAVPDLTVITNSHAIAAVFGRSADHRLYLLGGQYRAENEQTIGPMVLDQIALFRADHAVITVAAIDAPAGAMDADFDEAQIARAMIASARHTVVLSASSKFGRHAGFRVCAPTAIDILISETPPEGELAALLHDAGVSTLSARSGADQNDRHQGKAAA